MKPTDLIKGTVLYDPVGDKFTVESIQTGGGGVTQDQSTWLFTLKDSQGRKCKPVTFSILSWYYTAEYPAEKKAAKKTSKPRKRKARAKAK